MLIIIIVLKFDHKIILGNSQDTQVVNSVKDALKDKLDLLFIDGDHSEKGFWADYRNYSPIVRVGGIITVHDIKHYPKWKHVEVWKAWEQLKKQGEHEEFSTYKNYGIGILIKK